MRRAAAALLVTAVLLSGCSILTDKSDLYTNEPSSGGVPAQDGLAALAATPGIADVAFANFGWNRSDPGKYYFSSGMDIGLTVVIDPGYHIADPVAFVDYLGALAWSINGGCSPKGNVRVSVIGGLDNGYDYGEDFSGPSSARPRMGSSAASYIYSQTGGTCDTFHLVSAPHNHAPIPGLASWDFTFTDTQLTDLRGPWPGEMPLLPTGSVAPGSPVIADPPSVDVVVGTVDAGPSNPNSQFCKRVWLHPYTDPRTGMRYDGDVSITMTLVDQSDDSRHVIGMDVVTMRGVTETWTYTDFCEGLNIVGSPVPEISAEPRPGFAEPSDVTYEWTSLSGEPSSIHSDFLDVMNGRSPDPYSH
jgi:hypothetical protein